MDSGSISDTQRTMVLPLLQETNIRGKPYITVSSKGIVNGLSRYPNDGADFGPDTTLGATAPGQYGAPYTETMGILDAVKYLDSNGYGGTVLLESGLYVISKPVQYQFSTSIAIIGEAMGSGVTASAQKYVTGVMIMPSTTFPAGSYLFDFDNTSSLKNTGMLYIDQIEFFGSYSLTDFTDATTQIACSVRTGDTNGGPARQFIGHIRTVYCIGSYSTYTPSIDINNAGGPTYIQIIHQTYSSAPTFDTLDLTMEHLEIYIQNYVTGVYFNGSYSSTSEYSHYNIGTLFFSAVNQNSYISIGAYGSNVNLNIDKCIIDMNTIATGEWRLFVIYNNSVVNVNNIFVSGCSNSSSNYLFATADVGSTTYTVNAEIKNFTWYVGANLGTPTVSGSLVLYGGTTVFDGALTINNFVIEPTGATITATLPNTLSNIQIKIMNPLSYTSTIGQPSISTNPPVSGTAYQNTNPYDIRLKIPVTYNPTTTAAATLATGISSTSTVTTTTKVSIPSGLTAADGQILTYDMVVPAGQYFELVATNATIGTVEVQAA